MKKIKIIRSEKEYEDTLIQIEKLWGVAPKSSRGAYLDLLLLLVKDYEKRHYSIPMLDPIEALKLEMEEKGLNQSSLAKKMSVSRAVVSEVLNRKKPMSLNFIKFLYKELGMPPGLLLSS